MKRAPTRCQCGEAFVVTRDALGRDRRRCPTCDGVTHRRAPKARELPTDETPAPVSPFLIPCLEP